MPYDVVTFGEAMVRLSPPNFRRLEQARSLDVQVGGAELNTAVALARLGHSSAWVSRLTDNPLGRLIANHAREAGVTTEHVVWTKDDRVGVYFLEFGAAPRASSVLYDRKGAAIAGIKPGMVPWSKVLAGVKWFHHGTLLAMDAARARGSNPESCFDPFRFKLQQTGGCDRGANAAEDRSAVETAVLNIGRVSGDFGDNLDGEHVCLQQIFSRCACEFAEAQCRRR